MTPQGLRPMPYRKVARRLQEFGFLPVAQSGSHVKFRHPDGRWPVVPHHAREDIGRGLLASIVKEAGIDLAEFLSTD